MTHLFVRLAIIATIIGSSLVKAEDNEKPTGVAGFDVSVNLGLGGLSRTHLPYPVTVTVDNTSKRDFEGHLIVTCEGDRLKAPTRIPMTINTSSSKRFRFCLDLRDDDDQNVRFKFVSDNGTTFWEMPQSGHVGPTKMEQGPGIATFRVLTVTPDGRKLFSGGTFGGVASNDPYNEVIPSRLANSLCGSVDVFQLPEHDLPLYSFGAILVGSRARVSQLNSDQLRALTRYVAGGGALFISDENTSFTSRLYEEMPWSVEAKPERVSQTLTRQRIGLGRLFTYTGIPLVANSLDLDGGHIGAHVTLYDPTKVERGIQGPEPRRSILVAIDQLPEVDFPETVNPLYQYDHHLRETSPRALSSVMVLVVVFLLYTLATGPLVFIFRKKKVGMAIYLGCVMGGFVLVAAVTGAYLRFRKGDARCTTVTELTPDGAIQFIATTVKSCAGQTHRLRFEDDGVETWRLKGDFDEYSRYMESWEARRNWSIDLLDKIRDDADPNTVNVPLAPWGSGSILSRTYLSGLKPMHLTLFLQGSVTMSASNLGQLNVVAEGRVKNTWEIPLTKAELIVQIYSAHHNTRSRTSNQPIINRTAFISHPLGDLEPGEIRRYRKRLVFDPKVGNYFGRRRVFRHGPAEVSGGTALQIPRLASTERIQLILVAQVKELPVTRFGESDFSFSKGTHYIIQRLPLEEQPEAKGKRIDAKAFSEAFLKPSLVKP